MIDLAPFVRMICEDVRKVERYPDAYMGFSPENRVKEILENLLRAARMEGIRDAYDDIEDSDWFKTAYRGKSLGDVMRIEDHESF